MDYILLDTNFVSVLFDPRRPNYTAVRARAQAFSKTDIVYLSAVVLAELRYGMEAAQRMRQDVSNIRNTLTEAGSYPLAEIGRHTAEAYGEVKARVAGHYLDMSRRSPRWFVNRHSTVTHHQRPNMTHLQEGGTGGEVSEILFFSAKSKRRPSLIYSMQIIPVCLSIVARRKGVSATRRGGSNWTPISL